MQWIIIINDNNNNNNINSNKNNNNNNNNDKKEAFEKFLLNEPFNRYQMTILVEWQSVWRNYRILTDRFVNLEIFQKPLIPLFENPSARGSLFRCQFMWFSNCIHSK